MQVMGIDASDIVDVPATGSKRIHDDNNDSNPQLSKVMPSTPSNKAFNSTATPDDKRKDNMEFEAVTREMLSLDKVYVKLVKQQQKEMEQLKRRHVKERSTMQKEQCAVIDKLVANHDKERSAREKLVKKVLKKTMSGYVCTVTVCIAAVALFLVRWLALRMLIFY